MEPDSDAAATVQRLQEALRARALSVTSLARRAEVSEGTLRGILAGRRAPNLTQATTRRYARALGVRPAWLAFGDGDRDAAQ